MSETTAKPDIGERIMNLPAKVNRGLSNDYQNGFYDGHYGARRDAATIAREALASRDAEIARLQAEVTRLREACKAAISLRTLGFNEHYASTFPDKVDNSGVSEARYAAEAEKIEQQLQAALSGKGEG